MRVLLAGANGQLGKCFLDRAPEDWEILATDSDTLDITNEAGILSTVGIFKPSIIINCAAYTFVDKAEHDAVIAQQINCNGARNLAYAAKVANARFFHISTDYVFDGNSSQPYKETDTTNPQNVYGHTKYAGELAVRKSYEESVILRTSWIFSEYGSNFVKTMLRLANEQSEINIVSDQVGCPTYAGDIADVILYLIYLNEGDGNLFHYCGDQATSWYEFAQTIFNLAKIQHIKIRPICSVDYITAAKRPYNSVLNCDKIEQLGVNRSDWRQGLTEVLFKLAVTE